jgi:hypothetical protein
VDTASELNGAMNLHTLHTAATSNVTERSVHGYSFRIKWSNESAHIAHGSNKQCYRKVRSNNRKIENINTGIPFIMLAVKVKV